MRLTETIISLQPRVTRAFLDPLKDLTIHYGVIVGLVKALRPSVIKAVRPN